MARTGRPRKNRYWFRPHARGWLTEYSTNIARDHGLSDSTISQVLTRDKACDRPLAEILARYCGGRAVREIFDVSDARPPDEPAYQPFEDWRKWARLLRSAVRRSAPADVEFVGTDGSFLRTFLCEERDPDGLGFPTPYAIRSLRITMMSARRLQDLARARLVSADRVKVARAYQALFSKPDRVRRVDGTPVHLDFCPCDSVPSICGTRIGNVIIGGWSGFGSAGDDQLTVPHVLHLRRARNPGLFQQWTELLARAHDEARP